jgi:alpha(1,3/1,4) fucosyltransferase
MLNGSIYGWENGGDDIFNPQSLRNRDNCLEPMRILQQVALSQGIELHTADINDRKGIKPDFTLYVESIDFVPALAKKNYLILYETPLTVPRNADYEYLNQFDGIFTWNRDLLAKGFSDGQGRLISAERFIEIFHPNPIPAECSPDFKSLPFSQRADLVCLIGSNRHANLHDDRELYSERVRAIRWFEKYAPGKLKLYGNGWRVPQKRLGKLGKLRYRMEKIYPWLISKPVFPSYQGPATTKHEVLSKTKFCICFENARDIPGYLTEKIFDCLFAGCIPIYWGEANVVDVIPPACFIDFREFSNYDSLCQFISRMTPETFASYQNAAIEFLSGPDFVPYSSDSFANTIVSYIHQ